MPLAPKPPTLRHISPEKPAVHSVWPKFGPIFNASVCFSLKIPLIKEIEAIKINYIHGLSRILHFSVIVRTLRISFLFLRRFLHFDFVWFFFVAWCVFFPFFLVLYEGSDARRVLTKYVFLDFLFLGYIIFL